MNQASPQGQQAQNNSQAAQLAASQRVAQVTLYKPDQMRSITYLTDEEKLKYERGLAQLWQMHDGYPAGSPKNNEAKKKILDFGKMLTSKIQQRRQFQMQQQQQAAQQQRQAAGQPQGNPTAPAGATGQQTMQSPGTGVAASGGNAPQATPAATAATVAGPTMSTNAGVGASQAPPQQTKVPDHIVNHLSQMNFHVLAPAQATDKAKWAVEMRTKYTRGLLTMESTRQNMAKLDQSIKERTDKGNPLSPEEQKSVVEKKAQLQKAYSDALKFVDSIRKQVAAAQQKQQSNGAATTQGAQTGPGVNPSNPMQSSTATVNAAIEAAKNQQLAAAGRMPGPQQGQQGQGQPTPVQPPNSQAQSPPVSQGPMSSTTQAPGPQGQQTTTRQPTTQQQPRVIKTEPGTQPASNPIPTLNTSMASAASSIPSANTPTQGSARVQTPQSSTPTNGAPRALSHTAALTLANQRTGSVSMPGQPGQTPGVGSGQASGAGVMNPSQQGHPHAHPPQPTGQTLQSKLPIPKILPEKATQIPNPVSMAGSGPGYGRPTYSGGSGLAGGVMGQPALPKTPGYQLEGEGERVLNKKKLDELVRQVCGGTAEGQEGNLLAPEVEEVSCCPLPAVPPKIRISY